jgi:hypothetical protein
LFVTVVHETRMRLTNFCLPLGRRDHTISPSASATLVSRDIGVHRIPPHVRDVRSPLNRVGRGYPYTDLRFLKTEIFFRAAACHVGQISDWRPDGTAAVPLAMNLTAVTKAR